MSSIGTGRPAKHNPDLSPIIIDLTEERIRQGLSQSDIADAVGVNNRDYISKIENGRYICRYEYLENYAKKLGFRLGLVRQTPTENRLQYLAEHFTAEELRTAYNIKADEQEEKEVDNG